MAAKNESAISIRLPVELEERLRSAAEKLDLSKNDIARHAIRAAVQAIEDDGFRIELPMQMQLKKGPLESRPIKVTGRSQEDTGSTPTRRFALNETPQEPQESPQSPAKRYEGIRPKPSSKRS